LKSQDGLQDEEEGEGIESRRICNENEGDSGESIGGTQESTGGDEKASGPAQGRSRGV